jgi:hypothetical protein
MEYSWTSPPASASVSAPRLGHLLPQLDHARVPGLKLAKPRLDNLGGRFFASTPDLTLDQPLPMRIAVQVSAGH